METPSTEITRYGYLELILGCMFSGKTTYLVDTYNKLYNKFNIKVINYSGDTRYHSTMLSTHDKVMIPCIFTNTLSEVCEEKYLNNIDVILINEGQFFPDLYDTVVNLVEVYKKQVYVCGLDSDFKRAKFGSILDLIPISDNYIKLFAKCNSCGEKAIFSKRLTTENDQVVIGSTNYIPVCRHCYNN